MWDPPEADADDILGDLGRDAMKVVGPLALLLFVPMLLLIAAFGGLPEAIETSAAPAAVAEIPPDHLVVMQQVSNQTGIPWQILAAISKVESGFGANMGPSSAGAIGYCQFMPGTWALYGSGSPYDPVAALEAWGRYMSHLLSVFGGRYDLALAGYNWGENRSALRQALATGQSVLAYSIPSETRQYVTAILNAAPSPVVVAGDYSDDFYFDPTPTPYALPPVNSNSSSVGSVVTVVIIAVAGLLLFD